MSTQKYRIKNREIIRRKSYEAKIKEDYGLSLNEYNELFKKQNGNCAICGKNQSVFKYKLAVDHCHKTNKIRGLLCGKCNTALGSLEDDIIILQKAINYLKVFNNQSEHVKYESKFLAENSGKR